MGWQAPPALAVLVEMAALPFATPLALRPVQLELVVAPAGPVGLPELVVLVEQVDPAARSRFSVQELF